LLAITHIGWERFVRDSRCSCTLVPAESGLLVPVHRVRLLSSEPPIGDDKCAAIQLAKREKCRVLVTAGSAEKLEWCRYER
jgi:hypothetical protein